MDAASALRVVGGSGHSSPSTSKQEVPAISTEVFMNFGDGDVSAAKNVADF
jgi:hypothetical protein